MAFNKAPTAIFPGYSSDGTNISIPISNLVGLSAAEAHATTGDFREVVLAVVRTAKAYLQGLASDSAPKAMSVRVVDQSYMNSGDFSGSIRITYECEFYTKETASDMVDEPV